jgi:hypothetical protein
MPKFELPCGFSYGGYMLLARVLPDQKRWTLLKYCESLSDCIACGFIVFWLSWLQAWGAYDDIQRGP